MTAVCVNPLSDEAIVDYWAGELAQAETEAVESHVFSCADCAARLEATADIATRLSTIVRRGQLSGVISRSVLNRLQRDGVRVRAYSIDPDEIVPCAAFAEDDLVVVALKADLAGVETVTISVAAANGSFRMSLEDVPVAAAEGEVLWATPGALIRQMPSSQVTLRLAAGNQGRSLGEYVLDHTAGVVGPR